MSEQIPELWWCPSLNRILARHLDDDEQLVWVVQGHSESLRHYLGTGLDSNPPMPDDAVRLVAAPSAPRVWLPGDTVPADVWTVDRFNDVVEPSDDPWTWHGFNPLVELVVPSPEQWQSTVDRARAEREAKHDG